MFEDWGAEPSVPGGADGAGDGAPPEGFDGLEAVTAALSGMVPGAVLAGVVERADIKT